MTNQEMLTIVKMRGWRLKSTRKGVDKGTRYWYVEDENNSVTVSLRSTPGLALRWAMALITKNSSMQNELYMLEAVNHYIDWRKNRESNTSYGVQLPTDTGC